MKNKNVITILYILIAIIAIALISEAVYVKGAIETTFIDPTTGAATNIVYIEPADLTAAGLSTTYTPIGTSTGTGLTAGSTDKIFGHTALDALGIKRPGLRTLGSGIAWAFASTSANIPIYIPAGNSRLGAQIYQIRSFFIITLFTALLLLAAISLLIYYKTRG